MANTDGTCLIEDCDRPATSVLRLDEPAEPDRELTVGPRISGEVGLCDQHRLDYDTGQAMVLVLDRQQVGPPRTRVRLRGPGTGGSY